MDGTMLIGFNNNNIKILENEWMDECVAVGVRFVRALWQVNAKR